MQEPNRFSRSQDLILIVVVSGIPEIRWISWLVTLDRLAGSSRMNEHIITLIFSRLRWNTERLLLVVDEEEKVHSR